MELSKRQLHSIECMERSIQNQTKLLEELNGIKAGKVMRGENALKERIRQVEDAISRMNKHLVFMKNPPKRNPAEELRKAIAELESEDRPSVRGNYVLGSLKRTLANLENGRRS